MTDSEFDGIELKPCPFCGSEVKLGHYTANHNDWWFIRCKVCNIAIDPMYWNDVRSKNEMIKIWNRRITDD